MLRVEHQPRSQGLFPGLGTWERGWAEHPKRYQNPLLTPNRYDEHPRPFYLEVPPGAERHPDIIFP